MFISVTYLPKPSRLMIYGSCPLSCWNHFHEVHKTPPSEPNKSNDSLIQPPGNGSHDFDGSTKLYQRIPSFKIQHSSVPKKAPTKTTCSGIRNIMFTFHIFTKFISFKNNPSSSWHEGPTSHSLYNKIAQIYCEPVGYDGNPTLESVLMPASRTSNGPSSSEATYRKVNSCGIFGGIMEMRAQGMTNWSWIHNCMTHTAHISYVQQFACFHDIKIVTDLVVEKNQHNQV